MSSFPRYAIYYAPPSGSDLGRFGEDLLGYDAFTASAHPFPADVVQTVPDWRELTRDPRKYGFHATLKAPFFLATGRTEAELISACKAFADTARTIPSIHPVVRAIGGFIALVPQAPSADLQQLAEDCVREFDHFRAALMPEDRARRNPQALTPRQREYLDRWGYPYVREDFRFHMTLTGKMSPERCEAIVPLLGERFAALGMTTLPIDQIALFRQDDSGSQFRIISQQALCSQ